MASIGQDNQDKDIMLNHVKKYAFVFNEKVLALYDEVSEFINRMIQLKVAIAMMKMTIMLLNIIIKMIRNFLMKYINIC